MYEWLHGSEPSALLRQRPCGRVCSGGGPAPTCNFAGTWTDAADDTFTIAADGTDKWTITPRIVQSYDFSNTKPCGDSVLSLTKNADGYAGDMYVFQGTWNDGTTDHVVSAGAPMSGSFSDPSGFINVVGSTATQVTLRRTPDFTGTAGTTVDGIFITPPYTPARSRTIGSRC